ncbi:MAG: hypothetical protein HS113_28530 [Verrucomicrobiales bacterium]|nr:hypothetical protein [Verrucomicrobiales bacterium]
MPTPSTDRTPSRTATRGLLLAVAVSGLLLGTAAQRALNHERSRLQLTRLSPLTNAPPMLAFTTVALGGFRGLIANALWLRAEELQMRDRFFEALQLADWITKLDPHNPTVWRYHAWNMAYNIAGCFSAPEDRWRWVQRGIALLRDEALRYNPHRAELYTELATFYQHKLGLDLDPAHRWYKEALAAEMVRLLGRQPDFPTLGAQTTEDARRRVEQLRSLHGLEIDRMVQVDEHFGPLDWRLPEAHAIYWAHLGLERCPGQPRIPLRRVIWQSMLGAFRHGRLVENFADRRLDYGPNLEIIGKVHDTFEEALAADPDRHEYIGRAHKNFHLEVVPLLYTHNRLAEAAAWFRNLQEEYPEAVPPEGGLDEFVIDRVTRLGTQPSPERARGIIEGLLVTGYRHYALGDEPQAVGHVQLAKQIWRRCEARFAGQEQRVGLPPFEALQQGVLDRVLGGQTQVSSNLAEHLRQRTGLPQPLGPAATP